MITLSIVLYQISENFVKLFSQHTLIYVLFEKGREISFFQFNLEFFSKHSTICWNCKKQLKVRKFLLRVKSSCYFPCPSITTFIHFPHHHHHHRGDWICWLHVAYVCVWFSKMLQILMTNDAGSNEKTTHSHSCCGNALTIVCTGTYTKRKVFKAKISKNL